MWFGEGICFPSFLTIFITPNPIYYCLLSYMNGFCAVLATQCQLTHDTWLAFGLSLLLILKQQTLFKYKGTKTYFSRFMTWSSFAPNILKQQLTGYCTSPASSPMGRDNTVGMKSMRNLWQSPQDLCHLSFLLVTRW